MDPIKQIRAIVEYCGWEFNTFRQSVRYPSPHTANFIVDCPDILSSLDAMHEAILKLPEWELGQPLSGTRREFELMLATECSKPNHAASQFDVINATAKQRADAFTKVIGQWTR